MYHIFHIHSFVTKECCYAYIDKQKIAKDLCIFICARGMQEIHYTCVPYEKIQYLDWQGGAKKMNPIKFRAKLRSLLEELVEEKEFVYYTPNFCIDIALAFINHPSCSQYYLIEEGTISFYPPSYRVGNNRILGKLNLPYLLNSLLYRMCFRGFKGAFPLRQNHRKYAGALKISKGVFPSHNNSISLNARWERHFFDIPESKVDTLLVFDGTVESGRVDPYRYIITLLKKCIEVVRDKKSKIIHYKLHPAQDKRLMLPEYLGDVMFVKLGDEVCLESLCFRDQPALIFCLSSVSIYVKSYCQEFHCVLPSIIEEDAKTQARFKNIGTTEKKALFELYGI